MQDDITEEYVDISELDGESNGGWKEKIEDFLSSRYFFGLTLFLVAIISFCLGRLSSIEDKKEPVRVISNNAASLEISNNPLNPPYIKGETVQKKATSTISEQVVASKNGTKYHYPWCAGAKQISEKNKITFNSISAARAAGYSPASNCKGLK